MSSTQRFLFGNFVSAPDYTMGLWKETEKERDRERDMKNKDFKLKNNYIVFLRQILWKQTQSESVREKEGL